MDSTEAELENFRQKWREEVSAKAKGKAPAPAAPPTLTSVQASSSQSQTTKGKAPVIPTHIRQRSVEDEVEPHVYPDLGEKRLGRKLGDTSAAFETSAQEPQSALDHYEKAVEKESQGSLGDSLNLYRKAFKLDSNVHQAYRNKHFPPSSFPPKSTAKVPDPNPSNASVTVPNTAHHSLKGLSASLLPLIESFGNLTITGEPPPTDLSPAPPCPIAALPEELLVEILLQVAIDDVASFARLAQVCKRLAYLVTTEEGIWKRIVLGEEFGFGAMHYSFACEIDGTPVIDDNLGGYVLGSNDPSDGEPDLQIPPPLPTPVSLAPLLIPTPYPTYRSLFRLRPRIRFNGAYISTVNYTRPGAASPTILTWNSPIHIVTYYRYLRFFRDGTCISLLTVSEPQDVIPFLYPEHMHKNHGALPSAPMKDALPGRWRLSGPAGRSPDEGEDVGEKEGTLYVETEGATPKYLYKMALSVNSAGRKAKNNKLDWLGYWSYNKLTDDVGEFLMRNYRPYYFSRVKSYGVGM